MRHQPLQFVVLIIEIAIIQSRVAAFVGLFSVMPVSPFHGVRCVGGRQYTFFSEYFYSVVDVLKCALECFLCVCCVSVHNITEKLIIANKSETLPLLPFVIVLVGRVGWPFVLFVVRDKGLGVGTRFIISVTVF